MNGPELDDLISFLKTAATVTPVERDRKNCNYALNGPQVL